MESLIVTDAPHASLTGIRREVAAHVKANFKQVLVDAVADKLGHAYAVASGPSHFREAFVKGFGAMFHGNLGQCDNLADLGFQFLETQWRLHYPGESATQFLDQVHVPSPESAADYEKAVEDSWRVDIESNDEGFRRHYVGDARTRTGADAFKSCWMRSPDEIKKANKH